MPTILTFTIGPDDETYADVTECRIANAKDLPAADEQHIFLVSKFIGGLDDNDALVGYTDDATRNIIIRAKPSDVWDGIDPLSGVYFKNSTNNVTFRPISTVNFTEVDGICIDGSLSTAEAFGGANGGDFKSLKNLAIVSAFADGIGLSINPTLDNILVVEPGDDGILTASACNKVTVVKAAARGIVATSGSSVTNSLFLESVGVDFSNQGGTHSNNATEDTTAGGSNPQINRTTADCSNYAGDDFRTDNGSVLATAGVSGTFIGYAIDTPPATPIAFGGPIADQTPSANGEFRLDIASFYSGTITPFTFTITPPISGVSIENTSEVVIAQPTKGTLPTDTLNIVVRGTDNDSNTADSNGFDVNWDVSPWGVTKTEIVNADQTSGANPPFMLGDITSDLNDDRFRFVVTTQPVSGALSLNPDSTGIYEEAGDGVFFADVERFKNDLSYGSANINLTISSGITITGATANYSYSGIVGSIDLTGEIIVTGGTANYDYSGINATIELGAEIVVTGQTANYDYSAIDGIIELTGLITVTGQTANYDYDGIAADIILQGSIVVTGSTANYDYNALNGTIILQGPITLNPRNIIRVKRKSNTIRVKRNSNIIRVR